MLENLERFGAQIGNTELLKLEHDTLNLYAKLEYQNPMNSVKARAAYNILKSAVERGDVNQNTTVIESSSGNFAIALSTFCRCAGIKFIPVIDPNINSSYESILRLSSDEVVKVTERDETGGFLITRLNKIQELLETLPDVYWTNQYENPDNFYTHYNGTGAELVEQLDRLDYLFVGVSTGGTISGLSHRVKEAFPNVKVIAVDSEGSMIFDDKPKKRYIPGIGASIKPKLVKRALIDDVVIVPESKTVAGCHELFRKHGIFAGGSSGTSYYAIEQYFKYKQLSFKPTIAFLCPDNGMAYTSTIYNSEWVKWLQEQSLDQNVLT